MFGDEAGSHASDAVVSIGLVISLDPRADAERLARIREESRCFREIKYEKTDRQILPTCRSWIDAFVESDSLFFRATILRPRTRTRYLTNYYKTEKAVSRPDKLYNKQYCSLVRFARRDLDLPWETKLLLFLDEKSKPAADNFSFYLKKEIPTIRDLQFVDSKRHDLVQLGDLLNGCLRADFAGSVVTNEAKLSKVSYLKGALGVRRFGHLKGSPKFQFTMF